MTVGLRLVFSIVNCVILTIACILTVVSLGLFVDAYSDYNYNNVLSNKSRQCFLFISLNQTEFSEEVARYGVCHFVVAADVIVLLLILASGVATVMAFFTVKYVLCTCYTISMHFYYLDLSSHSLCIH